MRTQCQLTRLAKRVVKWFDGQEHLEKILTIDLRVRTLESYCKTLFFITSVIDDAYGSVKKNLHAIAYICLTLRDAVSLFTRVDITKEQVSQLQTKCLQYYLCYVLYFDVNPTVWHVGHVVSAHCQDMKSKYGLGLGLNSMEGREAKHIFIAKYSKNTIQQQRWAQIFMHEYVTLLWLRSRGYNTISKKPPKGNVYIPMRTNDPLYCYCGWKKDATKEECLFCLQPLQKQI